MLLLIITYCLSVLLPGLLRQSVSFSSFRLRLLTAGTSSFSSLTFKDGISSEASSSSRDILLLKKIKCNNSKSAIYVSTYA